MHVQRIFQQLRVFADRAEQVVVLGQRRQDQAHAARLGIAMRHGLIDRTEELLHVPVGQRLLDVGTLPGRVARWAISAVRAFAAVGFFAQHVFGRAGTVAHGRDLHQAVAIAFKQLEAVTAQAQNLVMVGRLRDTHQRLGVKAVGHHDQVCHRARQAIDAKHARRSQHREAMRGVVPKVSVVGQCMERL